MLLVIHNLPTNVRYSEVKELIKDRCNVVDLILDNLVYDTTQSRKVTVGLSDEGDAAFVLKELNGFVYMGQKLYVTDVRKNKPGIAPQSSFDQGYSVGNGKQNNEQNNTSVVQQTPPAMQNISAPPFGMPFNNPFGNYQYNMFDAQGTNPQYQSGVPTGNMMQAFGSNMGMTPQNANMPFSGPSNFTSYQPSMVPHPSQTQPDFIPFTNNKPVNEFGIHNQSGVRYFKKNVNEQRPPDKVQSFCENSRGSSGRSDRMSPSRNDRGFNEPRNRSSNSDERRYDGWNRSDEFSRRSGGSSNRSGEEKYSDRNQTQSTGSHSQAYDRNYKLNPDGNKYDYKNKTDYTDYNKDSYSRRFDDKYHHPSSMQSDKQTDNNYGRFNDRSYGNTGSSRFDMNKPQKNNEYKRPNYGSPMDKKPTDANRKTNDYQRMEPITYPIQNKSNKFNYNRGPGVQEFRNPSNVPVPSGKFLTPGPISHNFNKAKKQNPGTISVKDETWRNQAVAALVKDLLATHQMEYLKSKPGFLPFIKSRVRSRMDNILGKRVSVTLDQILEEYKNIYPVGTQKSFVTDAVNKFTNVNKKEFKPQGNTFNDVLGQAGPVKRKIPETFQPKPGNIKKFKTKPEQIKKIQPPQPGQPLDLPKSKKKAFQQLKKLVQDEFEGEVVYKLEPVLKKALDDEVQILVDLFNEECKKNEGGQEAKVCQRIMKISEKFKKIVTLDVTKRLLNINCNLMVRVYPNTKIKSRELAPLVKDIGISSIRKTQRQKFFVGICDSHQSFDRLCSKDAIKIESYTLRFRPLHVAGPKMKKKKPVKNDDDDEDTEDDDDDDDDDDDEEEGGANDGEYGDEEDDDDDGDENVEDNDNKEDAIEIDGDEKGTMTVKATSNDTPEEVSGEMITEIKDETPVKIECSEKSDENITAVDTNTAEEISETKDEGIEETGNNPETALPGTTNESIDVANIAQDDLEDF